MNSSNATGALRSLACFSIPLALGGALFLTRASEEPEIDTMAPVADEASIEEMDFPPVRARGALDGEDALGFDSEVMRLAALAPLDSPFVDTRRYAQEDAGGEPDATLPGGVKIPEFKLTSVVSSPVGALCSIDQKILRVGGELPGGWTVSAIDVEARSVTLVGPEDTETTLAMR